MFKNQRHFEIIEILKKETFVGVKDLSDRLYASQPTIRRDLDSLEKQGYVRRNHGGAMLADDKTHTPISFRKGTNIKEKISICRMAATLIKSGSLIFTDASTTAFHLSNFIRQDDNITVVTNGYSICHALAEKNIITFSTGGRLLKNSMAFVGEQAKESIRQFNADIMFFSASSLSKNGIISDYSEEETALRKEMKKHSHDTVFLCDNTKIGVSSAFRVFSLEEIDHIITDAELPNELANYCNLKLTNHFDNAYLYSHTV